MTIGVSEIPYVRRWVATAGILVLIVAGAGFARPAFTADTHTVAMDGTRFIPEPLVHLFERTAWPKAAAGAARSAAQGPKIDIGARMRGMWR